MSKNTASPNVLILIGAPAAGKGTIAKPFRDNGFNVISTGDMLREEIAKGTELGQQADAIMKEGSRLVGDDIVIGMVNNRMRDVSANGYVLDGFPRTVEQARALDALLSERGIIADNIHVLRLEVNDDILRAHVKKRFDEFVAAGQEPRRDDKPEVFEERLPAYKVYSVKLCNYYGDRVHVVDGNHNPQETLRQIQLVTGISFPPKGRNPQGPDLDTLHA